MRGTLLLILLVVSPIGVFGQAKVKVNVQAKEYADQLTSSMLMSLRRHTEVQIVDEDPLFSMNVLCAQNGAILSCSVLSTKRSADLSDEIVRSLTCDETKAKGLQYVLKSNQGAEFIEQHYVQTWRTEDINGLGEKIIASFDVAVLEGWRKERDEWKMLINKSKEKGQQ